MRLRIDDNLPTHTTEHDMRQLFSSYGTVLSVSVLRGSPHSKQFDTGLIELETNDMSMSGVFPSRCILRGNGSADHTVWRRTGKTGSTQNRDARRTT